MFIYLLIFYFYFFLFLVNSILVRRNMIAPDPKIQKRTQHNCQTPFNLNCPNGQIPETRSLMCQDALGLESGAIKDSQITASSQYNDNVAANQGRMNVQATQNQGGGWEAATIDPNQWLQVDLGSQYFIVTRMATQGRNHRDLKRWVTKYKLQYSNDGLTFRCYIEHGQTAEKVKLQVQCDRRYCTLWPAGQQGLCSVESTYFHSLTRRHMWVEVVVGSHLCSEGLSPGFAGFLPPQKPFLLNSNSIGKYNPSTSLVCVNPTDYSPA